jgi:glycosyltransferase involved in cell wall biosynthesis
MKILLVSTKDQGGGAEKVAYDLALNFLSRGNDTRLLVKEKYTKGEFVFQYDPYAGNKLIEYVGGRVEKAFQLTPYFRGKPRLLELFRQLTKPKRLVDRLKGHEDFNYQYPQQMFLKQNWTPDIVHAHNLHGNYFNLNSLPNLSKQIPFIWTLHDTWAITGHCGYFINCNHWLTGCGNCPDLKRPPSILRDGTKDNWMRKQLIYQQSKLTVVTPSKWLMNYVDESMLEPTIKKVIHNGVDTTYYKSKNKSIARSELGLPQDRFICLFVAFGGKGENPYKDYMTVKKAIERLQRFDFYEKLLFVCIGGIKTESNDPHYLFPGYLEREQLLKYYQSADVLLHAAIAENFPLVILESMASGTPVIATRTGGIPEIIEDNEDGFLIEIKNHEAMADKIHLLFKDKKLREGLSHKASEKVNRKFSLDAQVSEYLQLFLEVKDTYPSRTIEY